MQTKSAEWGLNVLHSVTKMLDMTPRKTAMTPEQLNRIFAASGLTRVEFAARLGVTRITLFRWMTGRQPIGTPYAALIRQTFKTKG